jgi:hypothetical protein
VAAVSFVTAVSQEIPMLPLCEEEVEGLKTVDEMEANPFTGEEKQLSGKLRVRLVGIALQIDEAPCDEHFCPEDEPGVLARITAFRKLRQT